MAAGLGVPALPSTVASGLDWLTQPIPVPANDQEALALVSRAKDAFAMHKPKGDMYVQHVANALNQYRAQAKTPLSHTLADTLNQQRSQAR